MKVSIETVIEEGASDAWVIYNDYGFTTSSNLIIDSKWVTTDNNWILNPEGIKLDQETVNKMEKMIEEYYGKV